MFACCSLSKSTNSTHLGIFTCTIPKQPSFWFTALGRSAPAGLKSLFRCKNKASTLCNGKGNQIKHYIIIPDPNLAAGIQLTNYTYDVVSGNKFHPLPAPYESIEVEGTVEGNVVANNKDVNP
jgi:hypothetical protein